MDTTEPNLWVQETWLDASRGHANGESDVYETYTDDRGELYRAMQREYGRCVSKVYIDSTEGPPKAVGWVFQGLDRYQDSDETYLRETWVTVHAGPPTRTVSYEYAS